MYTESDLDQALLWKKREKVILWKIGGVEFDLTLPCLRHNGKECEITLTEARILKFLAVRFDYIPNHDNENIIKCAWSLEIRRSENKRVPPNRLHKYMGILKKSFGRVGEEAAKYIANDPYHLRVKPEILLVSEEQIAEQPLLLVPNGDLNVAAISDLARSLSMEPTKLMAAIFKKLRQADIVELTEEADTEHRIRHNNLQTELLTWLYPDDALLEHNLARYVAKVNGIQVRTNIAVRSDADEIGMAIDLKHDNGWFALREPEFKMPSIADKYDEVAEFVVDSALLGVRAANDPVFCLQNLAFNEPSNPTTFFLANYFEYRLTSGKLGAELSQALRKHNPKEISISQLKRRSNILPNIRSLTKFSHRFCVGGVNVLFALRKPNGDFEFFVQERSENVASARGEVSLIPSGFHQPLTQQHASDEVSITKSVLREIWEEVFNGDDVVSHGGHAKADSYFKHQQIGWFKDNPNEFIFKLVCFGLDLIDGSYQFGVLLAVNNPDYWQSYGDDIYTNYEFKRRGNVRMIPVRDADEIAEVLQNRY